MKLALQPTGHNISKMVRDSMVSTLCFLTQKIHQDLCYSIFEFLKALIFVSHLSLFFLK